MRSGRPGHSGNLRQPLTARLWMVGGKTATEMKNLRQIFFLSSNRWRCRKDGFRSNRTQEQKAGFVRPPTIITMASLNKRSYNPRK